VLIALARPVSISIFHLAGKVAREIIDLILQPCWQSVRFAAMDEALIKRVRSELARLGGEARARKLGTKRCKEIAIKASKAAAKARTRKARERNSRQEADQE
jgi:hypothetical protein